LGIFSAFVFAAGVVGSLVAAVTIDLFGQIGFYIAAIGFASFAVFLIFLAPNVAKYGKNTPETQEGLGAKVGKILKLAFGARMRPLILYMMFTGLLLAIYNGFEFEVIERTLPLGTSETKQNAISSQIFTVEGAVTIVASFAAGKLADVIRRVSVLSIFLFITILAIVTSFASYYYSSLVLAYVMACLWGAAYSGGFTLLSVVMAKDFSGSFESYAIIGMMSNLATAAGFGFTIYVTNIPIFLAITAGVLGITQVSTCLYRQRKDPNAE